jgi:hypothetical protein
MNVTVGANMLGGEDGGQVPSKWLRRRPWEVKDER